MAEVFGAFLTVGLTAFGGPVAHLGYFRREFVERRRWLDEPLFAHLVAFCSILPGPTSSQVGLLIGMVRAGPGGGLAAWLGFTLPSACALTAIAFALRTVTELTGRTTPGWLTGLLAGLTSAATAVVADAFLRMTHTLCPDRTTRTIGIVSATAALGLAAAGGWQWVPIALGAAAGARFCSPATVAASSAADLPLAVPRGVSAACAALFALLVGVAIWGARQSGAMLFLATILRAGALVFGGGHVVLPLLQSLVPAGLVTQSDFYAGYGATQAMPGPLFTFAAFLGAIDASALHGATGAAVATVLIFTPSFVLIFALLPLLGALRSNRAATGALRGANAGVVGLLGALLYSPLLLALGTSPWRIAIALGAYALVAVWRTPPWIAVVLAAAAGAAAGAATALG
jgi:chromate transporter